MTDNGKPNRDEEGKESYRGGSEGEEHTHGEFKEPVKLAPSMWTARLERNTQSVWLKMYSGGLLNCVIWYSLVQYC